MQTLDNRILVARPPPPRFVSPFFFSRSPPKQLMLRAGASGVDLSVYVLVKPASGSTGNL